MTEYSAACGSGDAHDSHSFITAHFKERWCGGLCDCRCTCVEHGGLPHGPGDHK